MAQRGSFDLDRLRSALENRDLDTMVDLYADDAELTIINKDNPPRSPRRLRGKDQIRSEFQDVFSRDMTHRLESAVVSEDQVAYNEDCEYPDGTHVFSSNMLTIRDGRIARQTDVEVWDES